MEIDDRLHNKMKFEGLSREAAKEANGYGLELSRQLITVATVFIVFSGPVFSSADILQLVSAQRAYLMAGWSYMALSILAGMLDIHLGQRHLLEVAKFNYEVSQKIQEGDSLHDVNRHVVEYASSHPAGSPTWPLGLQAALFAMGLIALIVAFKNLLWSV